jgi:hypothetical protein
VGRSANTERKTFVPYDPLDSVPYYAFWREGVTIMSRNICDALRLGGEPVTLENAARFADSAPRFYFHLESRDWLEKSYCNNVLEAAWEKSRDTPDWPKAQALAAYFTDYFMHRSCATQDMLVDCFVGMAAGFREFGEGI